LLAVTTHFRLSIFLHQADSRGQLPHPAMSINATLAQSTGTHLTPVADLYASAGTDFSQLNWLEYQWASWYMFCGNPILATGIASFLLHEVRVCRPSSRVATRL
jgi:hypothetical protein